LLPQNRFASNAQIYSIAPISVNYYGIDPLRKDQLQKWTMSERLRQLKCPYEDYDMATMDSEGYMYVHPHFSRYPNVTEGVKCKVKKRLICALPFAHGKTSRLFSSRELYISKDTPSFGEFGESLKRPAAPQRSEHYSVDILAFDSTSRTMFMRHMPRTLELMNQLGYHILYGYNKVDNSMVNLEPILAGDIEEALVNPKDDSSGDINPQWILPTNNSLDPTLLPFLWKTMKEKFGCTSMFNDDIAVPQRGIFHYPEKEFKSGFTSAPSDHYYRAYYLAVYKNTYYSQCKDGGQIQREFIDLWRRFAKKYKNVCHFGFTFITSLEGEDRGTPPSLLNNDQLKAESHPRQTVKELKQHFGVDITISCRLNAIGEVKKLGKFIPLTAAAQPKGGFFGQHRDKRRKVDPLWQSSSLCTITRMRVLRR
uniref:DNA primase n=1 Tax=Heligmosomoides polygyrus TaxID=6339 RepID=A0A8L8JYP1_HELPZ